MESKEQNQLIRRFQAGDREAGASLLRAHNPFIFTKVRKWVRVSSPDFEDCMQEGRAGFLHACQKFDFREGTILTYASYWIKNNITQFLMKLGAVVRFPAPHYGSTPPACAQKRNLRHRDVFNFSELPDRMHEENERLFEDTLVADEPLADEVLGEEDLGAWVVKLATHALSTLDSRKQDVIKRRFANPSETLGEVGAVWKLSRERVRQLEVQSLADLSQALGLPRYGWKRPPNLTFQGWVLSLTKTYEVSGQIQPTKSDLRTCTSCLEVFSYYEARHLTLCKKCLARKAKGFRRSAALDKTLKAMAAFQTCAICNNPFLCREPKLGVLCRRCHISEGGSFQSWAEAQGYEEPPEEPLTS